MSVFKVGKATVTRIEETYLPIYPVTDIFSAVTEAKLAEHAHWLAPHHYDPASRKIKLSVHSWLLQLDGRKILIDGCCGNQKSRPLRPAWNMLDTPWLDRLAAAGARPDEIDLVMCTHLHHDHVGWNTQLKDGKWVPRFPNARYVFSKLDFDYFSKLDDDPATAPDGIRLVSRVRRAGGRSRARRFGDWTASPRRVHRHSAGWRPFTRTFRFQPERRRQPRHAHRRRLSSLVAGLLSGL
jgi:hypothetical protein